MISKLSTHNYKAFEDLNIHLKPITILLGPNNTGKSSIISSFRILSQTLSSYDDNVSMLLYGELGDFGTYKDIIFGNNKRKHLNFDISFRLPMHKRPGSNRDKPLTTEQKVTISLAYRYRPGIKQIVLKSTEFRKKTQSLYKTNYSEDTERQTLHSINSREVPQSIKSPISSKLRLNNFLINYPFIPNQKYDFEADGVNIKTTQSLREASRLNLQVRSILTNFEYLSGMRIEPSRTFVYSGERRNRVGLNGQHAINLMVMDSLRKGSKQRMIKDKVVQWMKRAEICSNIEIRDLSERHYEIYIQHPNTGEYQNYADVGYGNSQILPVLVGGYNLPPNSIFAVEQPEIHLHPKAQSELGDFFLDLRDNQVQSIVETHSEHLVLRLQQHIASGKIKPIDLAVYYIYSVDGNKKAIKMRINEEGIFTTPWPEGFFPERLIEAKKLAMLRGF
ncbi:AAA family ATPase [uncultured Desulfobacter sp.]|uniref:AAA family ATPase n=1 Tax=uncultured Desulfobacter sp. TaxID=240139 RepID=UPI002AA6FF22|nr:DUF3696 domain-containing protein [uncultured Desulfobacter sp.]